MTDRAREDVVAAVVVTYNRFDLLLGTIDALMAQTRLIDLIVLLDNGSTDGTYDRLIASDRDLSRIDYVRLEGNRGAARGFWQGMCYAHAKGADWVWIMDDDVLPEPTSLQCLLEALALLPPTSGIGYVQSRVIDQFGHSTNTPEIASGHVGGHYPEWERLLADGIVQISRAALTSTLIPRATLDRFPPPAPDFFIWGEDSDFTLRVTRELPGFLVGSSVSVHLRRMAAPINPLTERDPQRVKYMRYKCRNNLYIRRTHYTIWSALECAAGAVGQFVRALGKLNLRAAHAILVGSVAALSFRPRFPPTGDPGLMAEHRVLLRAGAPGDDTTDEVCAA